MGKQARRKSLPDRRAERRKKEIAEQENALQRFFQILDYLDWQYKEIDKIPYVVEKQLDKVCDRDGNACLHISLGYLATAAGCELDFEAPDINVKISKYSGRYFPDKELFDFFRDPDRDVLRFKFYKRVEELLKERVEFHLQYPAQVYCLLAVPLYEKVLEKFF